MVVKTIVRDNSRQFEMRIAQMKDAAEAALRGYKVWRVILRIGFCHDKKNTVITQYDF